MENANLPYITSLGINIVQSIECGEEVKRSVSAFIYAYKTAQVADLGMSQENLFILGDTALKIQWQIEGERFKMAIMKAPLVA